MSLYLTRCTPIPWDEPPHMPALPQPCTCSTGPVGTTPGSQHPQSRHEGMSLDISSVSSMLSIHHSHDLCQAEGPLTEVTPFNVPQHILPRSPLAPIWEHSHRPSETELQKPHLLIDHTTLLADHKHPPCSAGTVCSESKWNATANPRGPFDDVQRTV